MQTNSAQLREPRPRGARRRRGVALVMVIGVIALGAVMSYAMLASSSVQRRASHNAVRAAAADALAESGLNLGMYYLQHPQYAPSLTIGTLGALHWPGTGGSIGLGAGGGSADGTVQVTVTQDALNKWCYRITSTGRSAGDDQSAIERTLQADVYLLTEYVVPYAAAFTNDVALTSTSVITGDLLGRKGVTFRLGTQITGKAYYSTSTTNVPPGQASPVTPPALELPASLAEIRSYASYDIDDDGTPETATVFPSNTVIAAGTTLTPTAGNPAGVRIYQGNLTLQANSTIEGTVIVNGNLFVTGDGVTVRRAADGFPALLVGGAVSMNHLSAGLTVDGLCWIGQRITAPSSLYAPRVEVNGALLVQGTSPLLPLSQNGTIVANHDPVKARAPDLTEKSRTVVGVKVLRWRGGSSVPAPG